MLVKTFIENFNEVLRLFIFDLLKKKKEKNIFELFLGKNSGFLFIIFENTEKK